MMNANQSGSDGLSQNQPSLQPSYRSEAATRDIRPVVQIGSRGLCGDGGSSRRAYRWSKDARDLVRSNVLVSGAALSALITKLAEQTGYPRWACRRFVRRMGVRA